MDKQNNGNRSTKNRPEDEGRNKIKKRVAKYFVEGKSEKPRFGQLKFMRNLIVRNIAASSSVRLSKASFLRFLEDEILRVDYEVIDFEDCGKNVKEFMESPFGENIMFQHNYREEFGHPPFLLLRKVQAVMEEKLLVYLRTDEGDNATEEGKEDEKRYYASRKQRIYVDLLYCVALYEIFVKEYLAECSEVLDDIKKWLDGKEASGIMDEVHNLNACKDAAEMELLEIMLREKINKYLEECDRLYIYIHFYLYSLRQLQNLMAILRIILFIEFVSFNFPHRNLRVRLSDEEKANMLKAKEREMLTEKEQRKIVEERMQAIADRENAIREEAELWHRHESEWFKGDKSFFLDIVRNPNFSNWYKELNRVVTDHKLLKTINSSCDSDYYAFRSLINEYVACVEDADVMERTGKQEKHLWDVQLQLSLPVWYACKALEDVEKIF